MIVREYEDRFILIEQDHHARISGDIMKQLKSELFLGEEWRRSVEYAISNHDLGWKSFDLEPFWNDQAKKPYSFIDFPAMLKTALYSQGVDAVEKHHPYAALLCSCHYTRFMKNENSKAAEHFIRAEKERQKRLIDSISSFNEALFQYHFSLLRFGDNISLYLCLNEPGTPKSLIHPFFQDGIDISPLGKFNLSFKDHQTVAIDRFPFKQPFTVFIKQKSVLKRELVEKGLLQSYKDAPYEKVPIHLSDRLT